MTFHERIRGRMLALASLHGLSLSAASAAMGRNHGHLTRKLEPSVGGGERDLTTHDADEFLAALKLPPDVLEAPVLGEADRLMLGWLASTGSPTVPAAKKFLRDAGKVLRRLTVQDLVTLDGEEIAITETGRRYVPSTAPAIAA
jgi:hypothetical protein